MLFSALSLTERTHIQSRVDYAWYGKFGEIHLMIIMYRV